MIRWIMFLPLFLLPVQAQYLTFAQIGSIHTAVKGSILAGKHIGIFVEGETPSKNAYSLREQLITALSDANNFSAYPRATSNLGPHGRSLGVGRGVHVVAMKREGTGAVFLAQVLRKNGLKVSLGKIPISDRTEPDGNPQIEVLIDLQ